MNRLFFRAITALLSVTLLASAFSGCGRSAAPEDETPDNSEYRPLATPVTEFEQKLKFVRDAHFQYVWVFTRIDGKEFTSEDSELLKTNAPKVVDWVGMDDKKKFIAGFNFPPEPKALEILLKRYKIESYSEK